MLVVAYAMPTTAAFLMVTTHQLAVLIGGVVLGALNILNNSKSVWNAFLILVMGAVIAIVIAVNGSIWAALLIIAMPIVSFLLSWM
ncbi:MAG: hypothetical protein UW44_C0021G0012 [Candidatus Collierbacteria bacterium GW2011_GWB2_44_22]|uniref:Uncharacterized protein n=1 Tax=Candidatus Collierbacteria bacterium GW2011_GWB2_44_22 TaxID=1618387 RepID=A0A0G1HV11_9BACT|nr:MAG: hypothetical protein UW44_C0021G0012 [Candidatus Collierbacteria bacterium GW2011_GWB2_44_22]